MVSCILIALEDPFETDYYPYQVRYGHDDDDDDLYWYTIL